MATFSDDLRAAHRLTPAQVEALDTLSGYERGEVRFGMAHIAHARTLSSLKRRGLVDDGGITDKGRDVLNAYI